MTMSMVSASVKAEIKSNFQNALDLTTVAEALSLGASPWLRSYTNGTGANQIQIEWGDERTILSGQNETLDLTALAGGAFGTASFGKVKELHIVLTTATAGYTLRVGDAAATANKWTAPWLGADDIEVIQAGGYWGKGSPVDGMTVDGTHKLLLIANPSAGSVTYRIVLMGTGSMA